MNQNRVAQLRLEPGGLGRHDAARVGDAQQVFDGGRVKREGRPGGAGVHEPFQLRRAADAADEVYALVRARVCDAEHGVEQVVLQEAHVERRRRVVGERARRLAAQRQPVPPAAHVHVPVPGLARPLALRALGDVEAPADGFEKLFGRQPVQIFHDAVVGENLHLLVGEDDGEEAVVRLRARVVRVPRLQLRARARGGGRAVVAVGDVEQRHFGEAARELFGRGRAPDGVAHAVVGLEVVERLADGLGLDERVEAAVGAVGQEDGAGLRAQGQDVARAVVLLVGARALVLADDVGVVLVHGAGGGDAHLRVPAHADAVDVEVWFVLFDERALRLEPLEILARLRVDLVRVDVRALGQVYLGARDVEEAQRVVGGQGARLLRVDHVVGDGGDLPDLVSGRAQGAERVDGGHVCSAPPSAEVDSRVWNFRP